MPGRAGKFWNVIPTDEGDELAAFGVTALREWLLRDPDEPMEGERWELFCAMAGVDPDTFRNLYEYYHGRRSRAKAA